MSGSSGGSQTTVQKADPWSGVQQNLLDLYGAAGGWFKNANTVAGSNPLIDQSLALTQQRALQGTSLGRSAQALTESITSGNYTHGNPVMSGLLASQDMIANGAFANTNREASGTMLGNPYLQKMADAAARPLVQNFQNAIAPALASQFSMAGRTGSGSHVMAFDQAANTLGRQLSDQSTNLFGNAYEMDRNRMAQAYEAERARQAGAYGMQQGARTSMWANMPQLTLQAAGLAPALANMSYTDIQQLQNAGLLERGMQQDMINEPLNRLDAYSRILQGANGFGTTSTSGSQQQPYNRMTGALGGAATGAALGSVIPGLGTAVGAGIGGLMGLFG